MNFLMHKNTVVDVASWLAFDQLTLGQKVAIRLRWGKDLVGWYLEEVYSPQSVTVEKEKLKKTVEFLERICGSMGDT